MKDILIRLAKLFTGTFICAVGIVFMINANLGLGPWDALHEGIAKNIGITIGQATTLVGLITVILDVILGELVGWGTIINMITIGLFIDLLMMNNVIPVATSVVYSIIMLIIGMTVLSIGVYMYMSAGLGSGPRDGLMVALQKRVNRPVRQIKLLLEVFALIAGYMLGGTVGIGTVVIALLLGEIMQIVFNIVKFDTTKIKHRFITDDIAYIKSLMNKKDSEEANEEIASTTES